jgi:hypothetical protein
VLCVAALLLTCALSAPSLRPHGDVSMLHAGKASAADIAKMITLCFVIVIVGFVTKKMRAKKSYEL